MKLIRITYIFKTLSFISFSILLFSIINNATNVHSHQLANGEIVTHAHPYSQKNDNAPFKSHIHSIFEYLVLLNLNTFLKSSFSFLALAIILFIKKEKYSEKSIQKQSYFYSKQNKSPPYKIAY